MIQYVRYIENIKYHTLCMYPYIWDNNLHTAVGWAAADGGRLVIWINILLESICMYVCRCACVHIFLYGILYSFNVFWTRQFWNCRSKKKGTKANVINVFWINDNNEKTTYQNVFAAVKHARETFLALTIWFRKEKLNSHELSTYLKKLEKNSKLNP